MQNYYNSNINTNNFQNNYNINNQRMNIPINSPNNFNNIPFQEPNNLNMFRIKGNEFNINNKNEEGYISSNGIYSNNNIELSYHGGEGIYSENTFANNNFYNQNNLGMINSNQNQGIYVNNQNNQYNYNNNFAQNKIEKDLYQSEQNPSQMKYNQLDDINNRNIQSQQNIINQDFLQDPIFKILNGKEENNPNINQQFNVNENNINQQQNLNNINNGSIKEKNNEENDNEFENNSSKDKSSTLLRNKNISKIGKNSKDSKENDSKSKELSQIKVPSLTDIVSKELNINKNINNESQENQKEENINSEEINNNKNNNISIEKDNKSINNKNIIPVPSLSKIVQNEYNLKNSQKNENNDNINSNFADIKESVKINNNEQNNVNNEFKTFNLNDIPENVTIIKKPNRNKKKENNEKNYNNNIKNNENLNFDELIGEISNINNQNNEQIRKEESFIQVPSLTNIVSDQYNLNNDCNINNSKKQEENIIFNTKIKEFSEKYKDNIAPKNNNKDDKSIIQVPGLSQIVPKDYNLKNKNKNDINESIDNNIDNPAIFSFKNINDMKNYDNILEKTNTKEEKGIQKTNTKQIEIIYNLLNSNNSSTNNNYLDNHAKNNDNKEEKKDINFINNSFCLFRNNSNEFNNSSIELPNNIHRHPFNKFYAQEEILCSICEGKKVSQSIWKCENCPLIICNECTNLINYNYNLRDKHMHPLEILEKSFFICCICGKTDNLKKTFVFYCEDCNFAICPQCYFSK